MGVSQVLQFHEKNRNRMLKLLIPAAFLSFLTLSKTSPGFYVSTEKALITKTFIFSKCFSAFHINTHTHTHIPHQLNIISTKFPTKALIMDKSNKALMPCPVFMSSFYPLTHSHTMTPFDAPFPTVFSNHLDSFLPFSSNLKLSSAKSLSLEESKIVVW